MLAAGACWLCMAGVGGSELLLWSGTAFRFPGRYNRFLGVGRIIELSVRRSRDLMRVIQILFGYKSNFRTRSQGTLSTPEIETRWLSGGWLVGCLIGLLDGWLARCVQSVRMALCAVGRPLQQAHVQLCMHGWPVWAKPNGQMRVRRQMRACSMACVRDWLRTRRQTEAQWLTSKRPSAYTKCLHGLDMRSIRGSACKSPGQLSYIIGQ